MVQARNPPRPVYDKGVEAIQGHYVDDVDSNKTDWCLGVRGDMCWIVEQCDLAAKVGPVMHNKHTAWPGTVQANAIFVEHASGQQLSSCMFPRNTGHLA